MVFKVKISRFYYLPLSKFNHNVTDAFMLSVMFLLYSSLKGAPPRGVVVMG